MLQPLREVHWQIKATRISEQTVISRAGGSHQISMPSASPPLESGSFVVFDHAALAFAVFRLRISFATHSPKEIVNRLQLLWLQMEDTSAISLYGLSL